MTLVAARILISIRTETTKNQLKKAILEAYSTHHQLTEIDLMQDAIEVLERNPPPFSLIIFEHNTKSLTLVKAFIDLTNGAHAILCSTDPTLADVLKALPNAPDLIVAAEIEGKLPPLLHALAKAGKIPPLPNLEAEQYVSITPESVALLKPLPYDVYVRVDQGQYVCSFKKGTALGQKDLEKFKAAQHDFLYVKTPEHNAAVQEEVKRAQAQAASPAPAPAEAKKQFNASFALVRDVVARQGFTPEAQMIAKSSVAMSLKVLGSKPRLSAILAELKSKEGDYIVSHSFMLGQVSCALAHKIGWNSASTFLKLSLAAFLHDISLSSSEIAQIDTVTEAEQSGKFTAKDIQALKLHPMKAAEYSKQFNEIPSDVDQIIAQHHERPDGNGFPRQISGKSISPLSALFIMAHDLVHAVLLKPDTDVDSFFEQNAEKYQVGQFKKILQGFKSGNTEP